MSSAVWCWGGRVPCSAVRMRLGGLPNSHCSKSLLEVWSHNKNCHCVAFHRHRASVLTDIVFAFPLLCVCRMIIVWYIQYVNIIIVRGTGTVIMEQEMTCQDPWWPQRESYDLSLTLMFILGFNCDWDRSAALLRVIGGPTMYWKFPLRCQSKGGGGYQS